MTALDQHVPLLPGEETLLASLSNDERIVLGGGDLPVPDQEGATVRATFLRDLILGRLEHKLPPKGLRLRGADVSGRLDLQGCDLDDDISFTKCRLDEGISLVNAAVRGLHLSGSVVAGVSADNARFAGSVFIRGESEIADEISLAGARIAGDLQLIEARVTSKSGDALFAPSLEVKGSIYIGDYPYSGGITSLFTTGSIFLSSAHVGHDLFLMNTSVTLADEVVGENVFGASEEHGRDMAVSLARAKVGGILFLKDNQIGRGILNLAGASVARFKDEPAGPGATYPIRLDGFQYRDFSRHTDTTIQTRLDWLERRPPDLGFTAQPYEQLAFVLGRMGQRDDARTVLLRKETLLRADRRAGLLGRRRWVRWLTRSSVDGLLRWVVGYGYRPGRAVALAVILIAGLSFLFQKTWDAGDMAPNAAPIIVSDAWQTLANTAPNPAQAWSAATAEGRDWETFHPVAYAADVVIPIVDLGQEDAWAPSTTRSDWGRMAWWIRWFAKALGWIVTALGAAAITGVIRND